MYVEDMPRLFRLADPNMSEDNKLCHVMRGVNQELCHSGPEAVVRRR